jgi:hypothetical protein
MRVQPRRVWVRATLTSLLLVFFVAACASFSTEPVAANDAGHAADAGAAEASPASDASIPTFAVACGTASCTMRDGGAEVCCHDSNFQEPYTCVANDAPCPSAGGRRHACDDPADCAALGLPGRDCCGTLSISSPIFLTVAACVAQGSCVGERDVILCDRALSECRVGQCKRLSQFPADGGQPVIPGNNSCQP